MSDKTKLSLASSLLFLGMIVGFLCVDDYEGKKKLTDYETRITELEQSQCAVKESKVHADVKFEACMSQLRGRHEN